MKKESVQQEIILVATSTFSNREWCLNDGRENRNASQMEKLEQACWNGLLEESLPEAHQARKVFPPDRTL